jgi:hypothetical protein
MLICFVIFIYLPVGICLSQAAKKAPPAADKPATTEKTATPANPAPAPPAPLPAGAVKLTDDEAKDLKIAVLEWQNLTMQIDAATNDFLNKNGMNQAKAAAVSKNNAMIERFAKAHNLDLAKFRLDAGSNAFVPVQKQ